MPAGKPSRERRRCPADARKTPATGRRAAAVLLLLLPAAAAWWTAASFSAASRSLARQRSLTAAASLTHLALVPSGRLLRQPETGNAAVPLRLSPRLAVAPPEPARLFVGTPALYAAPARKGPRP